MYLAGPAWTAAAVLVNRGLGVRVPPSAPNMQVTALKTKPPGPPMDRNGYLRSLSAHDGPHFPIPQAIEGRQHRGAWLMRRSLQSGAAELSTARRPTVTSWSSRCALLTGRVVTPLAIIKDGEVVVE